MKKSINIKLCKNPTKIEISRKELKEKIKEFKKLNLKEQIDYPTELGLHGIKRTYYKEINISTTQYYKMSLRSGQKIANENSIVIIGDVNSGAEVISGENIIIIGTLRGLAHAGAKGNKKAFISAGSIEAPQIRIANIVKEMEKNEEINIENKKKYAYVKDKKIILE